MQLTLLLQCADESSKESEDVFVGAQDAEARRLDTRALRMLFLRVAAKCSSVICCRVVTSPAAPPP